MHTTINANAIVAGILESGTSMHYHAREASYGGPTLQIETAYFYYTLTLF